MNKYNCAIIKDGCTDNSWTSGTLVTNKKPQLGDIVEIEHDYEEFYTGVLVLIEEQ